MTLSAFIVQLLNGLAGASSLFLVAAGLSLIFGVTRIVNFAHGSFFMLGVYIAYTLVEKLGAGLGFWPALVLSALAVGAIGAAVEVLLLRRIYRAPELFQLLATFALVLVIKDAALWLWGAEDLLGPRAPGLQGAVDILGRRFPTYDLLLIVVGPAVLGALWLLLTRTRWGTLVRAATQDREMVGALGVNQAWLFTSVFALGAMLAGLGGALQLPREPASLNLDLLTIGDAFVVVVVGGMGSIPGAYVAALLIAEIKALCVGIGNVSAFGIDFNFSKLTLVAEFLVMAVVLVWRPWGLLGRPQAATRNTAAVEPPLRAAGRPLLLGVDRARKPPGRSHLRAWTNMSLGSGTCSMTSHMATASKRAATGARSCNQQSWIVWPRARGPAAVRARSTPSTRMPSSRTASRKCPGPQPTSSTLWAPVPRYRSVTSRLPRSSTSTSRRSSTPAWSLRVTRSAARWKTLVKDQSRSSRSGSRRSRRPIWRSLSSARTRRVASTRRWPVPATKPRRRAGPRAPSWPTPATRSARR